VYREKEREKVVYKVVREFNKVGDMTYNTSNAATSILCFQYPTAKKLKHYTYAQIQHMLATTPVASIITLKPFLFNKLLYERPKSQ